MMTQTSPTDPAEPPGHSVAAASRPARLRRIVRSLALLTLVLGMAGFNAWWYWRDTRSVPDRKAISAWMRDQRFDLAERALREQLRRTPNDGDLRIDLARVLGARNDLRGCASELHQVPFWWPTKSEALYREGSVYMMLGRAKDAEAVWQEVIKDDPLHPVPPDIMHDTCYGLVKLYATEDRWEDALPVIWRAYDDGAVVDQPQWLVWRMRSELEHIAPVEAVPVLRRYVAAVPNDWEAIRCLARAEHELGRNAEAERDFQACLKGRPDDPRVWRDSLTMYHERGDWTAFTTLLDRAPKSADREPEVLKSRGMVCEKNGDMKGAADYYRRAIEANPTVLEYHYRLSITAERLGLREEAAVHRKRSKELRDARAQLLVAYKEFLDVQSGRGSPGGPDLPTSIKRLASICKTLGFTRAAEAWNRLLASP
jgi:tetratricopeptide (TPR) repeat protein